MKILITGATGFIGQALTSRLRKRKDQVRVVSRSAVTVTQALGQDVDIASLASAPEALFSGIEAVVNLAGEPIFGRRWTGRQKERLVRSRVDTTRILVEKMRALPAAARPKVLVSGSAVGWYGPRGDEELPEEAPPGSDFLADLCRDWEQAALGAEELGVRVVTVRTGVVLGPGGGALAQMLFPFRLGLGGPVGSGRHWFPWIHREDHVSLMIHALEQSGLRGPMNATAPQPVRHKEFAKTLGRVLRRPAVCPVPPLILTLVFGEAASILTTGQRAVPRKAERSGFGFAFAGLEAALRDILDRPAPLAT